MTLIIVIWTLQVDLQSIINASAGSESRRGLLGDEFEAGERYVNGAFTSQLRHCLVEVIVESITLPDLTVSAE